MKHKYIETTWKPYTYDVWGNAKDGYEVNDRYGHSEVTLRLKVEIANPNTLQAFEYATPTDKQLRETLNVKPRVKLHTDGDDLTIYVNHASTGYQLGELHCTSHKSLSPIRDDKD